MDENTKYILIPWDDLEGIKYFTSIEECLDYAIDKYGARYSVVKMRNRIIMDDEKEIKII